MQILRKIAVPILAILAFLVVWEALVQGTTRNNALAAILAQYDVGEERAAADLDRLLGELAERGLIRTNEQTGAG